jgi:hypothetical protein
MFCHIISCSGRYRCDHCALRSLEADSGRADAAFGGSCGEPGDGQRWDFRSFQSHWHFAAGNTSGIAELKDPASLASGRVRRQGGGRKKAVDKDVSLKSDLQRLLESTTRGDPEAPLRWTCKSVRQLTGELTRMKHRVSHQVVADLLHALGYSLQANRKTKEGTNHPDRDAQFAYSDDVNT